MATNSTPVHDVTNYQKKDELEHILLRPSAFIGNVEPETQSCWVYDSASSRIVYRQCTIVPALIKLFDEILVNASDAHIRCPTLVTMIKVYIDSTGLISVTNNGVPIPIQIHPTYNVYVGELIFGHLRSSSNYNDNEKRIVGGSFGYGAKLCNIFSRQFTLSTRDNKQGLGYIQKWTNNMSEMTPPTITSEPGPDFTCISMVLDLQRFKLNKLSQDHIDLMARRAWDITALTDGKLKVYLNGVECACPSFLNYVKMFTHDSEDKDAAIVSQVFNDRWLIAVTSSSVSDPSFICQSWVNSISTSRGGTHVNYILDQLLAALVEHINKKHKTLSVKAAQIKPFLSLFINCSIENPSFDSLTKELLTTPKTKFGSTCELTEKFIKHVIAKTNIVQNVVAAASKKVSTQLKKTDGKKSSHIHVPKLNDAERAGTKDSQQCTLILCEGDSAAALVIAGLSVVGRSHYGCFALRGKLLNVREATTKQLQDNEEITAIKKILGLQQGVDYESTENLRYGKVMIMTDGDNDGSHIKSLICNLFATFWPSLIKIGGFLSEFITPVIKADAQQNGCPHVVLHPIRIHAMAKQQDRDRTRTLPHKILQRAWYLHERRR